MECLTIPTQSPCQVSAMQWDCGPSRSGSQPPQLSCASGFPMGSGQHRIRKLQRRIRKLPGPRIRKLAVPRIRKLQRRIRKLPGPRIRKLPGPRIRKLLGPRIRKLRGPRIRKLPGPRIRKLADPPGFGNFSVGFGNFQALGFGNLPIPPDSETSTSDSENTRGSDSETCLSPRIRKLQRRIRQLPGPRIRKLCHRQTASLYIGFLDDQPFGWHH